MRVIRFIMVFCLLLAVACMSMAQTSGDQNQPMSSPDQQMNSSTTMQNQSAASQNLKATVQPGPVLKAGMAPSADVFVGKKLALRVAAPAGGMSPMQRARIIADRLNQSFAAGDSWQNMTVDQKNGLWTVNIKGKTIATADARSARAMNTSSGYLARRWASGTVVAMGGEPQMIAMQLQPVQQRVAGSQQQLGGMNWTMSNTKSVPVYSAATGDQFGNITVAGSQSALNMVNSVILYQSTSGQATIWTFVPITGTSNTGTLSRVAGVGVVSVPSAMIPATGFSTGNDVMQMTTQMAAPWNNTINAALRQENLQTNANTKVVPLYSMSGNMVIGAAQIVGSARSVSQAQAVVASTSDTMIKFGASTTQCTPMMGQPAMLKDVVLSSIIMMSPSGTPPVQPGMAPPTGTQQPTTVQPGTSQPTTTQPEPSTTPITPDEGTEGSGY